MLPSTGNVLRRKLSSGVIPESRLVCNLISCWVHSRHVKLDRLGCPAKLLRTRLRVVRLTVNKDIEASARQSAPLRADALSAQVFHDDASVMIGAAERVLDDLRNGRSLPPPQTNIRRTSTQIMAVAAPKTNRLVRGIGAVAIVGAVLVFGAIFTWPTGNGSASLGSAPDIIAEAASHLPDDSSDTLPRPSSADAVSRLYAAEFAGTDTANVRCLAEAVYYEARGEPYIGQVAVAQVVLNRARSGKWSRGLCAVIAQGVERGEKCQFSYMCRVSRATPQGAMWDRAQEIAIDAVRGRVWLRELVEATHYHTPAVSPIWRVGLEPLGTFGGHVFYKTPELGFALSVARAADPVLEKNASVTTEKPESERSMEATSAIAPVALDFKLPHVTPAPNPVAASKPRPLVRQARSVTDASSGSEPAKVDQSWVRDLQNR